MKIRSHYRAHAEEIQLRGHAVVNGVTFRAGDDGKPLSDTVGTKALLSFVGVDGFSFYHDDGQYIGPSLKEPSLIDQATVKLETANSEARAHTLIEQMIREGKLTPEVIAALQKAAPTVQQQNVTVTGNAAPTLTATTTGDVTETAPDESKPEIDLQVQETAEFQEGEGHHDEDGDEDDESETDLTSVDALLLLPRAEFLGLASRYKVRTVATRNEVVAQGIVDAVLAERNPQPDLGADTDPSTQP